MHLLKHITALVPPLAPFFDNMITPDISARYTAEDALHALTELKAKVAPKCLAAHVPRPPVGPFASPYRPWQSYNRWAGLPLSFVAHCTSRKPLVRPTRKRWGHDWIPYFEEFPLDHGPPKSSSQLP